MGFPQEMGTQHDKMIAVLHFDTLWAWSIPLVHKRIRAGRLPFGGRREGAKFISYLRAYSLASARQANPNLVYPSGYHCLFRHLSNDTLPFILGCFAGRCVRLVPCVPFAETRLCAKLCCQRSFNNGFMPSGSEKNTNYVAR